MEGMGRGSKLTAAVTGFILFAASIILLSINEYNYVNTVKIADFSEKNAIEASTGNLDPSNENKLIHIIGEAYSQQTLSDSIISVPNAIAFFRNVEMYQWEEVKKHKNDNKIEYAYRKTWSKHLINSDNFESTVYKNPPRMQYEKKELYANNIGFGKFYLSKSIINKINSVTKITQLPFNSKFKTYNGFYFTGDNYDDPAIGDQKLSYSYIPSGIKLSIIAKQSGNRLENMNTKYGDFVIVMYGRKDLKTMLKEYKKNSSSNTWIFRGIGILLMFIGLNLLIQPIVNSGGIIPVFGQLSKMAAFISTIIITIALSTISISLCWLLFRPETAISLIVISVVTIFSLRKKEKVIVPE